MSTIMLLTKFPPWEIVYQQSQRCLRVGVFERPVEILRRLQGRAD